MCIYNRNFSIYVGCDHNNIALQNSKSTLMSQTYVLEKALIGMLSIHVKVDKALSYLLSLVYCTPVW